MIGPVSAYVLPYLSPPNEADEAGVYPKFAGKHVAGYVGGSRKYLTYGGVCQPSVPVALAAMVDEAPLAFGLEHIVAVRNVLQVERTVVAAYGVDVVDFAAGRAGTNEGGCNQLMHQRMTNFSFASVRETRHEIAQSVRGAVGVYRRPTSSPPAVPEPPYPPKAADFVPAFVPAYGAPFFHV